MTQLTPAYVPAGRLFDPAPRRATRAKSCEDSAGSCRNCPDFVADAPDRPAAGMISLASLTGRASVKPGHADVDGGGIARLRVHRTTLAPSCAI